MKDRFEFFVARRYLRAKRKQAVISVITVISIIGVAAGVMALVIALGINNGFRSTLERNLLGATAHVTVLEKEPVGIENWRELTRTLTQVPHVVSAAPTLYGEVLLSGPLRRQGAVLKGIDLSSGQQVNDVLQHLKKGSVQGLAGPVRGYPGIILGSRLAENTGMLMDSLINVINPEGELTPVGPRPTLTKFRVVGFFESGLYDLDASWAFTSLKTAQQVFSTGDVVNAIELKVDDINRAAQVAAEVNKIVGPKLAATHWMEQNSRILNALKSERIVTFITIGMIQMVAALNILIALIMMVMEKHKDIAILMSMGARQRQIRNIFLLEGVIIGVIGTVIGLIAGYSICYFANRYRWIPLDEQVYALSFVPFDPRWADGLWIAATAISVSFIATLYPARTATRIAPVEALRYE